MNKYTPHICVDYPPNNKFIFEEWFAQEYKGCNTDRELLPIFPTSFHVNNDYGGKRHELQEFCDTLDDSKRYFIICQYDDGCMVDWKGKDVLEFNMSKTNGVMLPLICMPHPYKFSGEKKYLVNFIGSRTHQIRNELEKFKGTEGWYISFEPHNIEDYCRIISESWFTLCPRGYGANSFRICEAFQYGSMPIVISDEFILPYGSFDDFCIYAYNTDIDSLQEIIKHIPEGTTDIFLNNYQEHYNRYYTYEGCFNQIIKSLEAEYHNRKQDGKIAYAFGTVAKPED